MNAFETSRRPRSLAELAWLELRSRILNGDLKPGDFLILKEQAEILGMSIMPVREAIKRLQQEGLVVQEPQRGAFVAPVSLEEMEDLYRTRIVLECLAVRLACGNITQGDYDRLSRILDAFVDAYARDDVRQGREYHLQFHLELYRRAGSPTLDRLIPPLMDNSERFRNLSIVSRGTLEERRLEHQRILDACFAGDQELADVLLKEHLNRTILLVRQSVAAGRLSQ